MTTTSTTLTTTTTRFAPDQPTHQATRKVRCVVVGATPQSSNSFCRCQRREEEDNIEHQRRHVVDASSSVSSRLASVGAAGIVSLSLVVGGMWGVPTQQAAFAEEDSSSAGGGYVVNMDLDTSAYDQMTRGGNSGSRENEDDGFNPIVVVAPLALGGFAFGASKLIGGPLVEKEEDATPRTQILKKPRKSVDEPPAFEPPKIEVPKIEVPEIKNPFASMGEDPLPPDQPRKSFPKRSEASFNFVEEEEDESDSSGVIYDALDESYQEDRTAEEREMEREMRKAERRQKRAEAQAKREQRKLEAAQRREERREEQSRTRAMKAEEAAERRAQRRAAMEAKAAAAKAARKQRKSASAKGSSPSGGGRDFLSALSEMRKPAAQQQFPAQTFAVSRKVKSFSNKSKSMAQKPTLAETQKMRNTAGGLPQGFPSVEDFEGLGQEEKLELCDKADAIVKRLEAKADAAEKFIKSPVTSVFFFLKPGAEKNAIKARVQAEEAAAAARSLRSAASNPLGGAGAAVAATVVGILGAGALLFGVLSGGSDSPPQSVNVNAKAPAPQTEQMRDIQAAEKIEGVQSGEVSAEDAYAMFAK